MYSVQLQMIRTVLGWYWVVSPWSEENVHRPDEAGLLLENIRISAIDHAQNSIPLFNILGWIQQILSTINIVGIATYLLRFPSH